MKKILIINTGGTFNKVYNPINGILEVDQTSSSIENIASKWLCKFEIINTIGKDSLEITNDDRLKLLEIIRKSESTHIIIVHGTDTMDITSKYLVDSKLEKCIVLTGAMVPYSINNVEATANLASAYGYIQALEKNGIYIAMNGVLSTHKKVNKDREKGCFTYDYLQ